MGCKQQCSDIHSGSLRQRVDIQKPTTPTTGETTPTYGTLVNGVAAEVRETTGGEYIRGRQVEAGINAVLRMRYRSDITPDMRIKHGSRYYNIVSAIDPTGLRRELVINGKEVRP